MSDVNNVKNFIDKVQSGDSAGAGEAFKDALRDKVSAGLDAARIDIAKGLFNADGSVNAASYSDPKPEIAGTGTFNADGTITPTGAAAQDGQAQIDLSADTNTAEVETSAGVETSDAGQ